MAHNWISGAASCRCGELVLSSYILVHPCLSLCLSVYLLVDSSVYFLCVCVSLCTLVCLSACLLTCWLVCLFSLSMCVCVFVCLLSCLFVCGSVFQFPLRSVCSPPPLSLSGHLLCMCWVSIASICLDIYLGLRGRRGEGEGGLLHLLYTCLSTYIPGRDLTCTYLWDARPTYATLQTCSCQLSPHSQSFFPHNFFPPLVSLIQ